MFNKSRGSGGDFRGGAGGFRGGRGGFGSGRSNRGGFGGHSGHGGGERGVMYPATCSTCGNACEVPFRPNGHKPVFCSNCFKRDGDAGSFDRPGHRSFSSAPRSGNDNIGAQLKEINAKLDALIEALSIEDEDRSDKDEDDEETQA